MYPNATAISLAVGDCFVAPIASGFSRPAAGGCFSDFEKIPINCFSHGSDVE
jgi:hypothetical protein